MGCATVTAADIAGRWTPLLDAVLAEGPLAVGQLHALARATMGWPPSERPSVSDVRLAGVVRELARAVADSPASRRAVLEPCLKVLAAELRGASATPAEMAARPYRAPYRDD